MSVQETMTVMLTGGSSGKPEPMEIPRRVGNVRIGEMLGEGAGGVVFSGFDEAIHRKVAVKLLHRKKDTLDDFALAELTSGIRSAGRVKHPNIVTVHSVETVGRMPAIVMEFINGISLRELLLRSGALDLPLALYVQRAVTSAVAALHEANVVHRDLKPANVMCDRDGGAHVCDFGLACEFDSLRLKGAATNIGGSPLYMAPEMFEGHISPQSDVYALGAILFELLIGAPPFSADTISELQTAHTSAAPPLELLDRRRVPEEVRDIVERALNKQRIMRFKSAGHMLRSLETLESLSVADRRDETQKHRVAIMVSARQGAGAGASPAAETPPQALTTFDLIAQRAKQKRAERDT